jgi:methylenetetrahydrofolate reductase (NADPH)
MTQSPPAASLLRDYSIEVLPRSIETVAALADIMPAGSQIYIAYVPSGRPNGIVAMATELRNAGFVPVPHIAARNLTGYTQFTELLARLHGEAGTNRALVIGGDVDHPAGPFHASLDLLLTGAFQKHGFTALGFACYPERHRKIDGTRLREALAAKLALVREQGIAPWLVSQFCLEAPPIVEMAERLRDQGITAPLRIGVAGPTDRRTLWKYALHCGIGSSIRALGTRADVVRDILVRTAPDELLATLAAMLAGRPELGIAGVHMFSFGGPVRAAEWANAVREGNS